MLLVGASTANQEAIAVSLVVKLSNPSEVASQMPAAATDKTQVLDFSFSAVNEIPGLSDS